MAFEVEGIIYKKFDTDQVTETFQKREFILEIEDGQYKQLVKFQLTQANCVKIDPFEEGDRIKVQFSLTGREYKKGDKTIYFTNLNAWRIDPVNTQDVGDSADFPEVEDEPPSWEEEEDDLPF